MYSFACSWMHCYVLHFSSLLYFLIFYTPNPNSQVLCWTPQLPMYSGVVYSHQRILLKKSIIQFKARISKITFYQVSDWYHDMHHGDFPSNAQTKGIVNYNDWLINCNGFGKNMNNSENWLPCINCIHPLKRTRQWKLYSRTSL